MRVITMAWRISREYVGMVWDIYLGPAAICKKDDPET
jgi:hypothetical protein